MNEKFQGIDDRIFNIPIYKEEDIVDYKQDHPSVKDKNV